MRVDMILRLFHTLFEIYGEQHALILALCKDSCRKAGCGEGCKRLIVRSKGV